MIYRGTTPIHIFSFPFTEDKVEVLYITYFQKGKVIFEKTLDDVTFDEINSTIEVQITQEETLAFEKYTFLDKTRDSLVLIQIRTKLVDGECWVSEVMKERVGDVLKDGII